MFKHFFKDKKYALYAWGVLAILLLLSVAQVYMATVVNDWYKIFYDSLQNKNYDIFISSLLQFSWMAAIIIVLATANLYIAQIYCFKWREALTFAYVPQWRATDDTVEGASQRIQEDIMRWSTLVHRLGLGFFKANLTLFAFIPKLWVMSDGIIIFGYHIPGILVWIALVTSIGGLGISALIGRKLPILEYNNQKTEAAFRKSLVLSEDSRFAVDMETLSQQFAAIRANYRDLYNNFKWYTLWENSYGQASMLIPYIIGAPSYFASLIKLGDLVQISNAFDKVHDSFNYFIINWISVNELRSIIIRLKEFEASLDNSTIRPVTEELDQK